MKLVTNLFVALALISMAIGVSCKFYNIVPIFDNVSSQSYLILSNTFLLFALAMSNLKD